jgi:hypothetical protein
MVLIYVNKTSSRLQYIASFIFKELIKTPYSITSHAESFRNFDGIKLNYTEENISENELKIADSGFLYQVGIIKQSIEVFEVDGIKAFFKSPSFVDAQTVDEFPFDIFSASFYLLSRYEEYLPHENDKYGRYDHRNSLAFQDNFLHIPLINIWIEKFSEWIQKKDTGLMIQASAFRYIPTYDIDIAYAYLHKGWGRSITGSLQSVLGLNLSAINERLQVLTGKQKDPFDNYDWLVQLHGKYALQPIYFFLMAKKNSLYDKNILPVIKAMQQLVVQHAEKYSIGLHPSWHSGDDASLVKEEKNNLENISGLQIKKSRQHYLRFKLPQGYRRLIDAGLENDYSMGYATINGFRASVASSHFWYDVDKEKQTKLRIHPFCYMDSTAIYAKQLPADEAYHEMLYYYNACKGVNGTLITILHNHFLGSDKTDWRNIYEKFLDKISS